LREASARTAFIWARKIVLAEAAEA
jgi:hypothetical protein